MSKNLLIVFIIFISFFLRIPAEAQRGEQFAVQAIRANMLSDANAVVRFDKTRFVVRNAGRATEYHHYAVTVLNENGEYAARFFKEYSHFVKVTFTRGYIYNGKGRLIRIITEEDIKDYAAFNQYTLYSGYRIKAMDVKVGYYPYTVEYEWEEDYKGLINYPTWIPQKPENISIEKAELCCEIPFKYRLRIKELNTNYTESEDLKHNSKLFTWKIDSLPAYNHEIFSSDMPGFLPLVILAPEVFSIEGFDGKLSSWKDFGNWTRSLMVKEEDLPEETREKVKALVSSMDDPREKVRKVYEYMQSKTRYVSVQLGIGGWQPIPAHVVDRNGYGDCKALTNYMQTLLKVVGIPSYYSLVYGNTSPGLIFEDFPYNAFNHAILCVPLGTDTLWLECTSQTNPVGYTGGFTDNRYALVIGENGGTLVKTNHYSQQDNTLKSVINTRIGENGDAGVEISSIYSGIQYQKVSEILTLNNSDQKKFIYDNIDLQNFEIVDFKYSQVKDVIPQVSENLKIKIKGFASSGNNRFHFNPVLLNRWKKIPSTIKQRKSGIIIRHSTIDIDSLLFVIPSGLTVEYLPANINIINDFGSYSLSFISQGETIICTRSMKLNEGQFPVADYQSFAGFLKEVARNDNEKVVLRKSQ